MHQAARSQACAVLAGIVLSTTSCGHYRPKTFMHFPEYGTMPVLTEKGWTRALPLYVALDRDSLPQTEADARPIAEANAARLNKEHGTAWDNPLMRPVLTVGLPVILIDQYIEAGRNSDAAYREDAREREEFEARLAELGVEVTVRVTDASGRAVEGAQILPLVWPARYRIYGDADGRRTYPRTPRVAFMPSTELSTLLANTMLEDRTSMEVYLRRHRIAIPDERTDSNGVWRHVNPILAQVPKEYEIRDGTATADEFEGPFDVHYLVAREGFAGSFANARIAQEGPRSISLDVRLVAQEDGPIPERDNPWQVARGLAAQVSYCGWTQRREIWNARANAPLPDTLTPPLAAEEFDRYLEAAIRIAPDFPLTHQARFWHDVQAGDLEAAKRHAMYVPDADYMYAIHHVEWFPRYVFR